MPASLYHAWICVEERKSVVRSAPSEFPVRASTVCTDSPSNIRAEGSERSVRPRRERCVEPEADRPPSRRVSSYDITDDLPQQMHDNWQEMPAAQFGDLTGAMNAQSGKRWTTYKASMANHVITEEQVEQSTM